MPPTRKPIELADLRRCREILEALAKDRTLVKDLPNEERIGLLTAAGQFSRPERAELIVRSRRLRRAGRRQTKAEERARDDAARATSQIRVEREKPVFVAPHEQLELPGEGPELVKAAACYVCKRDFKRLHFFYDSMCKECGDFNYRKRFQKADLSGKTALVTGARVKIGFQIALTTLRAGAKTIVLTRFPKDAALRYAREADYGEWKDRLQIHGLDLRHSPSVEVFARFLAATEPRLDVLINNACQTVRRPGGFFKHLLELERTPVDALPEAARAPLRVHEDLTVKLLACERAASGSEPSLPALLGNAWSGKGAAGLSSSAELSQIQYGFDESEQSAELFPAGRVDADLQQVDLRAVNSWRLGLGEVATPEMLEVQLVNAVAPFILNARLKPLMLRTPNRDKHIVNVSAMEGIFSRGTKTDKHPHTNMAKAALNMMTRTSASDYEKDGIHMNAVDTGWVTDEDPAQHAARKREELGFSPPLDIVDGAARVCDPIFAGLLSGVHAFGKFFKDYKPANW